jgi:beta-galactosidase
MKKLLLILCVLSKIAGAQTGPNDWENPWLVDRNKEKPHAGFMLFEGAADVKADDYGRSPWYQSLNGTWKFRYTDK